MPGHSLFLLLVLGCVGGKTAVDDDADGDGYPASTDCDDSDPAVHPTAVETCDGEDEDCDGVVDEEASDASTWFADADGDGYGDPSVQMTACAAPAGYTADATDCDDSDPGVRPGGVEVCGGGDEDCDGEVDESDAVDAFVRHPDADGDGYGDPAVVISACVVPAGYVADSTDCDDTDALIHPGAFEHCGGGDEDCDGEVDEADAIDAPTWYADADGDGFGDATAVLVACTVPAGYTADTSDCDDTLASTNPAAPELCGGADEDCDGVVDEDDAADALVWYADRDGDGYGSADDTTVACVAPVGFGTEHTDCDDTDAGVNPAAAEACGGGDENCDGVVDEDGATGETTWYADTDGDGFGDVSVSSVHCAAPPATVSDDTDCDDTDASVNPGASEVCRNGVDDNCDGAVNDCELSSMAVSAAADVEIVGSNPEDGVGSVVAGLGDTDGDGCADVVTNDEYAAYVFSGCTLTGTVQLSDAVASITVTAGTNPLWFGPGGDVDGDGYSDAVLGMGYLTGTTDVTAVFLGPLSGALTDADAGSLLTAEERLDFPNQLAIVRDVDGDGLDDLLVGAQSAGTEGRAYLVFGPTRSMSLADADAIYDGEGGTGGTAAAHAGTDIASAGDINGDGYGDVLVGSPYARGSSDGAAYVVFGPAGVDMSLVDADAILVGDEPTELVGANLGSGDVDGDGYSDVLTGTASTNSAGSRANARLAYGPLSGTLSLSTVSYQLQGELEDEACKAVATSDVDGNGTDDILVTTRGNAEDGRTYLYTSAPTADTPLADAQAEFDGESDSYAWFLVGPGDVNGDGYDDVMIGAPNTDHSTTGGNEGSAFITLGTGL